jgi:hypothetical protein
MTMNGGHIRFYLRITVHFFITVNDSLRQHESGHFLTYRKKNINMTMNGGQIRFYLCIYCRTLGILWYIYK